MNDMEVVLQAFPDAEVIAPSTLQAAYAVAIGRRQSVIAQGVDADDAWKQAAVTLRWESRMPEKGLLDAPVRRLLCGGISDQSSEGST